MGRAMKELPSHTDDRQELYNKLMSSAQPAPTPEPELLFQVKSPRASRKNSAQITDQDESSGSRPKFLQDYTAEELRLDSLSLADVPIDVFWKKYFEPLQKCKWFPKKGPAE